MRSWCYRHPSVAFFALLAWVLLFGLFFAMNMEAQRWWRAALDLFVMGMTVPSLLDWWERT